MDSWPRAKLPAGACNNPITISAKDDTALRDEFNRARGLVRLVFLIDLICPTCLRGLNDLDTALLAPHAADASLRIIIIHTPVLGATEKDTANTCRLVHNEHVRHFWDPQKEIGTLFAKGLGLKMGDRFVYAWDVWAVYGPEAEWSGSEPPKADFLMHQLGDLMGQEGFPFLRAPVFRDDVERRLRAIASDVKHVGQVAGTTKHL